MTKIKLDYNKLSKLDRDRAYIFEVEVGDRNADDTLNILTAIKNNLENVFNFKSVFFIPVYNGKSEVETLKLDDFLLGE